MCRRRILWEQWKKGAEREEWKKGSLCDLGDQEETWPLHWLLFSFHALLCLSFFNDFNGLDKNNPIIMQLKRKKNPLKDLRRGLRIFQMFHQYCQFLIRLFLLFLSQKMTHTHTHSPWFCRLLIAKMWTNLLLLAETSSTPSVLLYFTAAHRFFSSSVILLRFCWRNVGPTSAAWHQLCPSGCCGTDGSTPASRIFSVYNFSNVSEAWKMTWALCFSFCLQHFSFPQRLHSSIQRFPRFN